MDHKKITDNWMMVGLGFWVGYNVVGLGTNFSVTVPGGLCTDRSNTSLRVML